MEIQTLQKRSFTEIIALHETAGEKIYSYIFKKFFFTCGVIHLLPDKYLFLLWVVFHILIHLAFLPLSCHFHETGEGCFCLVALLIEVKKKYSRPLLIILFLFYITF